jgi:hypothetical protein
MKELIPFIIIDDKYGTNNLGEKTCLVQMILNFPDVYDKKEKPKIESRTFTRSLMVKFDDVKCCSIGCIVIRTESGKRSSCVFYNDLIYSYYFPYFREINKGTELGALMDLTKKEKVL